MLKIIDEKDNIIKNLTQRMDTLTKQTKKLSLDTKKLNLDIKENSMVKELINKQSPISLSINMKPSNQMEIQYKKMMK